MVVHQRGLVEHTHAQKLGSSFALFASATMGLCAGIELQLDLPSPIPLPPQKLIYLSLPFVLPPQKLIDLQNTRGGRVKLNAIVMPETEYDHPEKGGLCVSFSLVKGHKLRVCCRLLLGTRRLLLLDSCFFLLGVEHSMPRTE